MQETELTIAELGNDPPLIADGRAGPPDRREVSARWLTGTFLTGVTSTVLMGVALIVALDGREQLATPPEIADIAPVADDGGGEAAKTTRLVPPRQVARAKNRRRMEVSMMTRVGDRDVIKTMPFVQIKMPLAAGYKTNRSYPPFDPLAVFAEDGAAVAAATTGAQIYGSKIESEMSLKTIDFPIATATFDERSDLTSSEVEEVVRTAGASLTDGAVQVAALHYVDPQRFGDALDAQTLATASYGIRITQENVSIAPRSVDVDKELAYAEDLIPFNSDRDIAEALADAGYAGDDAKAMAAGVADRLNATTLRAGTVLCVGLEVRGEEARMVRLGVYDRTQHVLTVAVNERNTIVTTPEAEPNPGLQTAFDDTPIVTARGALPSIYDGIYQAAYSYGMSRSMTRQLVRLLASDVDFQSRLSPTDQIEVFFTQPDDADAVSDDSELLYVATNFGGVAQKFYRFASPDGSVDYFDEEGRSSKQFLLRKPVPNAVFRSGFGGRNHPILGYNRMHTGVDWAAPRGTPIIAAGNGVVEKAGWAGGYGRQTIVRHANGYETSYNHQSGIAKGIKPGTRVRQGQVIGFVGTTGLSTGPHLHFELVVNGTKVDPMRVRLPSGRALKDDDLERFQVERKRIDDLLKEEKDGNGLKVASAGK
ncbi:M23 family metallopeptidase [Mesorhizobium sp. LHD-90]|uniref:M23 family metallopeptidase n=1 Tax=Mesorhizobium sp. LHD-90 TaxID=3071414 RepID=UPI0027DF0D57|nr:M23 family metallopeptidase [Mesorhizobium sp. LHD-90]MDQ6432853.1 M23 family metallopeptidase [Mesorhizobium sp. LHD-90]